MNTNPPATSAEEGATSAPLEKLPKLNLPPKPILATAATPSPTSMAAPTTKPTVIPPSIGATSTPPPTPAPIAAQSKKTEAPEIPTSNKKRATLSMPLAMFAFVVALLGLIVQIFAFLHLF